MYMKARLSCDQEIINLSTKSSTLFFEALKKSGLNAVVDGEIVVLNEKGVPDFGGLQTWRSEADGKLILSF